MTTDSLADLDRAMKRATGPGDRKRVEERIMAQLRAQQERIARIERRLARLEKIIEAQDAPAPR